MAKKLKLSYDRTGDVLDVSLGESVEAISREIADDFFIRVVGETGEVVGFSILNFAKWFKDKTDTKSIPVSAQFKLVTE